MQANRNFLRHIAATVPCLRPFMLATATNYGAPAEGHKAKKGSGGGVYGRGGAPNEFSHRDGSHGRLVLKLASQTSNSGTEDIRRSTMVFP